MRLPHLAFTALTLLGCGGTHSAPTTPTPAGHLSSLEYDLYAMIIKHEQTVIFTPDSTTPVVCIPGVRWDPCQTAGSGPPPEAWTDFIAVNKTAVALDSAELAARGIHMVGPVTEAALRVCPIGPAEFHLSRVGFNHDSTEAVVRSGSAAGKGAFEECGYSGGETSLYRRKPGGTWKRVGFFSITMS